MVDRLNSFDAAIERAQALSHAGPARVAGADGAPGIALEDVALFLPDGRRIVETNRLVLASGESVALSGPSGSGKSTLFRAISGIWPYGEGRIRIPEGIHTMVVPPKPYIPISTLRAAVSYPAVPGTYRDDDGHRRASRECASSSISSTARMYGRNTSRAASNSALRLLVFY